jgi:hypothetical protein
MRYVGGEPGKAPPGPFTYRSFFEASADVIERGRVTVHAPPRTARRYAPGARRNWEAQHPPLYYIVLAPAYVLTRDASWGVHLFALRSVSYALAWLALLLGAVACVRARGPGDWALLGLATWPFVFPAWFPEMARLGNDSLCALLIAGLWWLTSMRCARSRPCATQPSSAWCWGSDG